MKRLILNLFAIIAACMSISVSAQDVMIARSKLNFPEAMSSLQNAIINHKYTLSRVQRIDIGLTKAGFKTDLYRVVFFGKQKELKWISDQYPELAAYLPLKIAIFAERDEAVAVALDPGHYIQVAEDARLKDIYIRWTRDIQSILKEFRTAE